MVEQPCLWQVVPPALVPKAHMIRARPGPQSCNSRAAERQPVGTAQLAMRTRGSSRAAIDHAGGGQLHLDVAHPGADLQHGGGGV